MNGSTFRKVVKQLILQISRLLAFFVSTLASESITARIKSKTFQFCTSGSLYVGSYILILNSENLPG